MSSIRKIKKRNYGRWEYDNFLKCINAFADGGYVENLPFSLQRVFKSVGGIIYCNRDQDMYNYINDLINRKDS